MGHKLSKKKMVGISGDDEKGKSKKPAQKEKPRSASPSQHSETEEVEERQEVEEVEEEQAVPDVATAVATTHEEEVAEAAADPEEDASPPTTPIIITTAGDDALLEPDDDEKYAQEAEDAEHDTEQRLVAQETTDDDTLPVTLNDLHDDPLLVEHSHRDYKLLQTFLWDCAFPLTHHDRCGRGHALPRTHLSPPTSLRDLREYLALFVVWQKYRLTFKEQFEMLVDSYVSPLLIIAFAYRIYAEAEHDPSILETFAALTIEELDTIKEKLPYWEDGDADTWEILKYADRNHLTMLSDCLRSVSAQPYAPMYFENAEDKAIVDEGKMILPLRLQHWIYGLPSEAGESTLTVYLDHRQHPRMSAISDALLRVNRRVERLQALTDLTIPSGYYPEHTEEEHELDPSKGWARTSFMTDVPEIVVKREAILFLTSGAIQRVMERKSDYYTELPSVVTLVADASVTLTKTEALMDDRAVLPLVDSGDWATHPLALVQRLTLCGMSVDAVARHLPRCPLLSALTVKSNLEQKMMPVQQLPMGNLCVLQEVEITHDSALAEFAVGMYGRNMETGLGLTSIKIYGYMPGEEGSMRAMFKGVQWRKLHTFALELSEEATDVVLPPLRKLVRAHTLEIDAQLVNAVDFSKCVGMKTLRFLQVKDAMAHVIEQVRVWPPYVTEVAMVAHAGVFLEVANIEGALNTAGDARKWHATHVGKSSLGGMSVTFGVAASLIE